VRPNRYITLKSEVAGRIQEIYVSPGEWVKKNQALAVIDSSRQAQSAGQEAQTSDAQRTSDVLTRGQSHRQEKITHVSPLDGIVADIPTRVGQVVFGGLSGTTLMTIADMSAIYVEVNVEATEISRVKVGQQAMIVVDAFGEKGIRGLVTYKNPRGVSTANEFGLSNRVNVQEAKEFKVTIELRDIAAEMRNRLRPGMSATATILTRTKGKQ
jgi:HlyD family secretion protein